MLKEFKHYLKINVDSKNTRKSYYSRLNRFFNSFDEFNQENVNEFFESLIDDEISKSTFNNYIFAFKKYCEFSEIEIKFPKQKTPDKSFRTYVTEKELYEELFPYFPRIFNDYKIKIFACKILFYTGMRPTELENLVGSDVDFSNNTILIRNSKGKRDRKVPFPKSLVSEIKKYLTEEGFNIKYIHVKYIFERINQELMYKKKLSAYSLRHSFAEFCLEQGLPVEHLQILLGHSDIKTTMIYARPKPEQAINNYFDTIKIYKQ